MSFSVPDHCFEGYDRITPSFLTSRGIRCLLCDIDNTLVTYDDEVPTEGVRAWLASMKEAGIAVVFLSNNHEERVKRFAQGLENAWYADAGKPFVKKAKAALAALNVTPQETAVLGDQIFTDVWTGNFLGAKVTLIVPPIRDKTNLFFKSKRLLEKPFLAYYRKRESKKKQTEGDV